MATIPEAFVYDAVRTPRGTGKRTGGLHTSSILGIGFPPRQGGVLQFIDGYPGGVGGFVVRADAPAEAYGERFRPPGLLRDAVGTLPASVGEPVA